MQENNLTLDTVVEVPKLKQNPDFMIFDFETLSHDPSNCIVASFGAIAGKWSDSVSHLRDTGFYRIIDIKDQLQYGRSTSESVLKWWKSQPPEVQSILHAKDKHLISDVLGDFSNWCQDQGVDSSTTVWIRAPHFDFVIIDNLYKQVLKTDTLPFSHWKVRDTRTACDILYKARNGYAPNTQSVFDRESIIQHNALEDCLKEFLQLRPYFNKGS